ncbi:MAG: PEP-CTERM sorting domain-containing protein [Myxococcota bacterium]
MKKLVILCASVGALLAGPALAQDSAVINFTADLNSYSGIASLDPFAAGTPVNGLVQGTSSFALDFQDGVVREEWLQLDGQIVIPNFTGDGTYTITPDGLGDGGIYLLSPLLNRVETVSLRTEGPLQASSIAAGFGRQDGQPTQQRDDIYLPDFTPNGTTIVTISGNNVSIDYDLDFNTLSDENARFLRDGVTTTGISIVLDAEAAQFENISVVGSATATVSSEAKGGTAATTPYGGFTTVQDPLLDGNLANTITGTTLGLLETEIAAGNISSDGRNLPTTVFLTLADLAPFNTPGGTNFFYDLTGTSLDASVTIVPEPTTALLALLGLAGLSASGRRKAA